MIRRPFISILVLNTNTKLTEFINETQIKSLTYDERENKTDSATILIEDLSIDQIENDVLEEDKPLLLSWGVYGEWQLDRRVLIKEISYKYMSNITATITCRDIKQRALDNKSGRSWNTKTSSEIVQEIATILNLESDIISTTGITKVVQGNRSYAKILSDLAYLEGYFWTVRNNTLIYRPSYEFDKLQSIRTYYLGSTPNIVDFTITTTSRVIASSGSGVTASQSDTKSGKQVSQDSNPADEDVLDEKPTFSLAITYNEDGTFESKEVKTENKRTGEVDIHPANEDIPIAKKRARAKVLNTVWKSTKATLNTLNIPTEVGDILDIKGVAPKHSGKYKVISCRTTYNSGHIKTQSTIVKNTKVKTGKIKGDKPKGTITPQTTEVKQEDVVDKVTFTFNEDGTFDRS